MLKIVHTSEICRKSFTLLEILHFLTFLNFCPGHSLTFLECPGPSGRHQNRPKPSTTCPTGPSKIQTLSKILGFLIKRPGCKYPKAAVPPMVSSASPPMVSPGGGRYRGKKASSFLHPMAVLQRSKVARVKARPRHNHSNPHGHRRGLRSSPERGGGGRRPPPPFLGARRRAHPWPW